MPEKANLARAGRTGHGDTTWDGTRAGSWHAGWGRRRRRRQEELKAAFQVPQELTPTVVILMELIARVGCCTHEGIASPERPGLVLCDDVHCNPWNEVVATERCSSRENIGRRCATEDCITNYRLQNSFNYNLALFTEAVEDDVSVKVNQERSKRCLGSRHQASGWRESWR